jgi:hypothetical protein
MRRYDVSGGGWLSLSLLPSCQTQPSVDLSAGRYVAGPSVA